MGLNVQNKMIPATDEIEVSDNGIIYVFSSTRRIVSKSSSKILRLEILKGNQSYYEYIKRSDKGFNPVSKMCLLQRVKGKEVYINMDYVVEAEPFTLVEYVVETDTGVQKPFSCLIEDNAKVEFKTRKEGHL